MKAQSFDYSGNIQQFMNPNSFQIIRDEYKTIKRADNKKLKLNHQQKYILDLLINLTSNGGKTIVDYNWIAAKIEKSKRTVKRVFESLEHLFKFKFERVLQINSRVEYNKIIVTRKSKLEKFLSPCSRSTPTKLQVASKDTDKSVQSSEQKCLPLYIKKNKINYNLDLELDSEIIEKESKTETKIIQFPTNNKTLISEFYPLSEQDAEELKVLTLRNFELKYINQLLSKLIKKKPDHSFFNKKIFMKYMSSILTNELRAEETANKSWFSLDTEIAKKNKYLTDIENSRNSENKDKVAHFKQKIASRFDTERAYEILTKIVIVGEESEDHLTMMMKGIELKERFIEINIDASLALVDRDKALLHEEARAVWGNSLTIKFKEKNMKPKNYEKKPPVIEPKNPVNLGKEGTVWNKISKQLLDHYGEDIHMAWFSKLEAQENAINIATGNVIQIEIFASTRFIGDEILSRYGHKIEEICRAHSYTFHRDSEKARQVGYIKISN